MQQLKRSEENRTVAPRRLHDRVEGDASSVVGRCERWCIYSMVPCRNRRQIETSLVEADMSPDSASQHRKQDTAGEVSAEPQATAAPRFWIVPSDSGHDRPRSLGALPYDDVPDEALIAALVAGEPEALGALYDRHARVVFSVIMRIAGDRDVAEEILQEVFLRAWQQAHTFDETRGTVRFWLHRIAHNLTLNELRRRQRRPQVQRRLPMVDSEGDDYADGVATGQDPAVDAWCAVRDAELAHALDQLPPGQRAVLLLYAEGFSQSEIAAKLGEPLGTVKSRMRRALCRLREALPTLGIDASWRGD
jgi:RNA polymerase sigma-70 factor (ECF subfamily)